MEQAWETQVGGWVWLMSFFWSVPRSVFFFFFQIVA
jgi:hypothetical protein